VRFHFSRAGESGVGMFIVGNRILRWKDTRKRRLYWSERKGIYRHFYIGPWYVTFFNRLERNR
jgi:hypothetical protein